MTSVVKSYKSHSVCGVRFDSIGLIVCAARLEKRKKRKKCSAATASPLLPS